MKHGTGMTATLCLLLVLLSGCGPAYEKTSDNATETPETATETPYDGTVADADVLIRVPQLRQYGAHTCGADCVQMTMNWLHPYGGDLNLKSYAEELGTTEEDGTTPADIESFFEAHDVTAEAAENRSTSDIIKALDEGHVMLMCIQAWSDDGYNTTDPSDSDTYLAEGHWVICVGYQKSENRFFFNDPACVGYCMLEEDELDARWIDMDGSGRTYDHYGIEVSGDAAYDPDGYFHLE